MSTKLKKLSKDALAAPAGSKRKALESSLNPLERSRVLRARTNVYDVPTKSPPPVARRRAALGTTRAPVRTAEVADSEEEAQEEQRTRRVGSRLISTRAASVRCADAAHLGATEEVDKEGGPSRVNIAVGTPLYAETEKAAPNVVKSRDGTGDRVANGAVGEPELEDEDFGFTAKAKEALEPGNIEVEIKEKRRKGSRRKDVDVTAVEEAIQKVVVSDKVAQANVVDGSAEAANEQEERLPPVVTSCKTLELGKPEVLPSQSWGDSKRSLSDDGKADDLDSDDQTRKPTKVPRKRVTKGNLAMYPRRPDCSDAEARRKWWRDRWAAKPVPEKTMEDKLRVKFFGYEGATPRCSSCRISSAKFPDKAPDGTEKEELLPCGCLYKAALLELWCVEKGLFLDAEIEREQLARDGESVEHIGPRTFGLHKLLLLRFWEMMFGKFKLEEKGYGYNFNLLFNFRGKREEAFKKFCEEEEESGQQLGPNPNYLSLAAIERRKTSGVPRKPRIRVKK